MGANSSHIDNPCEQYHTVRYQKVAIIAASSGFFSLLASTLVILVIVLFKKHHIFIQRLILYLCIAAALNAASITLRFSRMAYDFHSNGTDHNENGNLKRLCMAAAFIDQTTIWALTLAFCCLTFNMLIVTLFNKSTQRLEVGYFLFIFLVPVLFNWVPFLHESYGEAGAWCWIRAKNYDKTDDTCTTHKLGVYLRYALWYVPHYLILATLLLAYLVVVANVVRKSRHWRGLYNAESQSEQQKMQELVMPLIFYPLGFLFLNLFPLINRINDSINHPTYVLWVLHATFSPLQGGFIALVYVLDKDTVCRLRPRELWAYMRHRRTPVRDYPAARGFTDSYDANKFSPEGSADSYEVTLNKGKKKDYGSVEQSTYSKYGVKSEQV